MRAEKESIVSEYKEILDKSEYSILMEYSGLTVEKLSELRSGLRKQGASLKVIKNSFLKKILAEMGCEDLADLVELQVAMISGDGDASGSAKLLKEFIKGEEKNLSFKGGLLGDKALTASDITDLANIPARSVLLGQLVGTVVAPMTQLVGVMNQKVLSLLYVLKAAEEKKSQ